MFQLFKFELCSFFTEMELQRQYCISMITRISPQKVNGYNVLQLLHNSKELSMLWDTGNSGFLATMKNMLKNSFQDLSYIREKDRKVDLKVKYVVFNFNKRNGYSIDIVLAKAL